MEIFTSTETTVNILKVTTLLFEFQENTKNIMLLYHVKSTQTQN